MLTVVGRRSLRGGSIESLSPLLLGSLGLQAPLLGLLTLSLSLRSVPRFSSSALLSLRSIPRFPSSALLSLPPSFLLRQALPGLLFFSGNPISLFLLTSVLFLTSRPLVLRSTVSACHPHDLRDWPLVIHANLDLLMTCRASCLQTNDHGVASGSN